MTEWTYASVLSALHECDMTMSRYDREGWDRYVRASKLTITFPFIHITGTNGKGSTAKYIAEIYRAQGYKVALFTKPFVNKPNEMMWMNGKIISDADFTRLYAQETSAFDRFDLSAFERETALAFLYFNEQKPDIGIIECGMGGATDSTNLYDAVPLLSIITSVALEHTAFLGRTVSEIAWNKGAIVKPNSSLLVGKLEETAADVLREVCQKQNAKYFETDDYHHEYYESPYFFFDYRPYTKLEILSPGRYQLANAATAIEAVKLLNDRYPVDEIHLREGLLSTPLPCRMERHHNIYIDGAHNPEAIDHLMDSLEAIRGDKPVHVLFAAYRDKNIAVMLPRIGRDVDEIILTTFAAERARDEDDYFLYLGDYTYNESFEEALNNLIAQYPDDLILVTGSLDFAFKVRSYVNEVLHL